jgi:hypothetical protein
LATAYVLTGNVAAAWFNAREAERPERNSLRVRQILGILHVFAGNRAEGRRLLEATMRRDP